LKQKSVNHKRKEIKKKEKKKKKKRKGGRVFVRLLSSLVDRKVSLSQA